ncbi:hypothetical protein SEA_JKERNS_66 [Arthrobacter phage JKerns]|uniref:Uncharacterized protein n=1 Tax=Arthrobacter phage JKerns TaxID=2719212 RepID=A0A6G9LBJ2_9CAUD|nr:hypothetical protein SEA_JKERNS_66 [Arthrobacter phage JKerns]
MTTWYEIEELDEQGRWQKTLTTRDAGKALGKAIELAMTSTTLRQTTFYSEHDADRAANNEGVPFVKPAVKQPPVNVPGIGRIVHYYQGSTNKVLPAIIKGIGPIDESGGSRVKLEVFWDGREDPLPADGYRPFSSEYASGCWTWPPRA